MSVEWIEEGRSKKGGTHSLIKGEFPNLNGKGDILLVRGTLALSGKKVNELVKG
jgi:hypothetical protein